MISRGRELGEWEMVVKSTEWQSCRTNKSRDLTYTVTTVVSTTVQTLEVCQERFQVLTPHNDTKRSCEETFMLINLIVVIGVHLKYIQLKYIYSYFKRRALDNSTETHQRLREPF